MSERLEINHNIETVIETFFKITPGSWVTIDFNYASMNIEKLSPSTSDRGRFRILADHKLEFVDKCYIDYADGFPRYYFNFDCMIKEIKSWIEAREKLEIKDIVLSTHTKEVSIKETMVQVGL